MKTLSFAGCVTVIILLFIAGRVSGQNDSMMLRFRVHAEPIHWVVTTTVSNDWDTNVTHKIYTGTIPIDFVVNQMVPHTDTVGTAPNPYSAPGFGFIIDSTANLLRKFVIAAYVPTGIPLNGAPSGQSVSHYLLTFDSIPFNRSLSSISVQPNRHATALNAYVMVSIKHAGGSEMGGWDTSGIIYDSVFLEMDKIIPASVIKPTDPRGSLTVTVTDGGRTLETMFSASPYTRSFEIFDFLGKSDLKYLIPCTSSTLDLPVYHLPPGCYFARLGDQVAKFVVPPR